jgi:hypothetical protein
MLLYSSAFGYSFSVHLLCRVVYCGEVRTEIPKDILLQYFHILKELYLLILFFISEALRIFP